MFRFGFCDGDGVKEDDARDEEEQKEERVRVREVQPSLMVSATCDDVREDENAGEVRAIAVHGGASVSYYTGAGDGGVSDLVRGEYEGGFKLWDQEPESPESSSPGSNRTAHKYRTTQT